MEDGNRTPGEPGDLLFEQLAEGDLGVEDAPPTRKAEAANPDRHLADIRLTRGVVAAGHIQVIDLARLRKKLGARWPHLAERVHNLAERVIAKHLVHGDLFRRFGEVGYVIIFGELPEVESSIKCTVIADEIARYLLGSDETDEVVSVRSYVKPRKSGTAWVEVRRICHAPQASGADIAKHETRPKTRPGIKTGAIPEVVGWDEVRQSLGYRYMPIWNVKRQVLTNYLCTPTGPIRSADSQIGYQVLPRTADLHLYVALDLDTLEHAKQDLNRVLNQGRRLLVTCPVHYLTLSDREARHVYSESCRLLPRLLRRHMVFEVVGAPEDVASTRLIEMLAGIRLHEPRAIFLRGRLEWQHFAGRREAGIHGVAADLRLERDQDEMRMDQMDAFARAADRAGLRSALLGAQSFSLASGGVCAGFGYVAGDAIAPDVETPEDLLRFQTHKIFECLLRPNT